MDSLNNEDRVPGFGASLVNTLLGAFLVISPLAMPYVREAGPQAQVYWNDILCGLAIVITGMWAMRSTSARPNWAQVVLGAWLGMAPIVLQYHFNAGWNDMVIGAIVCLSGLVVAAQKS